MTMQKLPPIEKIPEAFSVLADERITVYADYAEVISSNGTKQYSVLFQGQTYASNDSATYWQGYPGYPILATWMKQGILSYPKHMIPYFKDIDWNSINKKHKRNYAAACEEVLDELHRQGADIPTIKQAIQTIYEQLSTLSYEIKRNTKKPIVR